jgi:ATP-dependent helicase/DNAse subunit B
MGKVKEKVLSASRLKTLETCSWSYWCNYSLRLPQKQNEGALRGTLCHLIFELLLKEKHKKHYDEILLNNNVYFEGPIRRLIFKHLNKMENDYDLPLTNDENTELINKMILIGLKTDFFGEGGQVTNPELEFLLEKEDPKYKIRGFIDKPILYEKEKKVKIVDYKSSKYKFRGEELKSNVQAMTYTLAAIEKWPDYEPSAEFLFLRFPKSPLQKLKFSKSELVGFEHYLSHAYKAINNYSEEDAKSNYAADNKNSWMCKINKWRCPYLDAYDYYVEEDKKGNQVKASLKKEIIQKNLKEGNVLKKKRYEGCPRHKNQKKQESIFDDDFFN